MILLNKHLKENFCYNSIVEMFPNLYDENGRQVKKTYICFDESGENIIVETDGETMPEVIKKVKKFIQDESEKALIYLDRVNKQKQRLENILKACAEAKGE